MVLSGGNADVVKPDGTDFKPYSKLLTCCANMLWSVSFCMAAFAIHCVTSLLLDNLLMFSQDDSKSCFDRSA